MAEYTATSGSYTTTLTVTEGAYDVASNTSPVTFTLTLKKNSGSGLWNNDSCPWSININGTSYSGTFTYDFRNYSSLTLKSSTTQTITHNGDGTKKIAVSASVNMDNTPYVYTMSPSGELTLATIPRASDIALSVSSFSITSASDNAFTWTITAKSNSFYNRLRYSIGNKSNVSSNKGQGSSNGYFTNQELLSALPTSTSGSLTVYCDTYSDSGYSNLIGSKSVVITVSVNTSYIKPSVSLGNIGINSSPISGYAVAGYSKVQSSWSTSNSYGATSVTTYFTVSTGSLATTSSSSTSGTVVSNVIPSNASNYTLTIYAYAKDSRGAVGATVSKSITVYGYQPPTANLTAYRTSSSSSTSEDGAGTYAYVTFSGAVRSSVNSQNSIQSTVCKYSGSISGTATSGGHYALADTQSVTFKLTVTDKVTSSTASVTIATAQYPLDLYDNGNGTVGVGLGAVAVANEVKSALVVNMPNHFSMESWSAGGTTGYAVLATLTVTKSHINHPINFTITKRSAQYPIHVCLKLTNVDSVDPGIANFYADSYLTGVVWANKSTTSTFQIIAVHPDWEDMAITDTQIIGQTWSGITVDYTPSLLTALPSTAVAPTAWTYAKADIATSATRADNATNATNATEATNAQRLRSYSFDSGDSACYVKLGTLTANFNTKTTEVIVYTGQGFNAGVQQNGWARVQIKNAWQSTASATGAFGITYQVFGMQMSGFEVVGIATDYQTLQLWAYIPWGYGAGNYVVMGYFENWVHDGTTTSTSVPSGTQQNRAKINSDQSIILWAGTLLGGASTLTLPTVAQYCRRFRIYAFMAGEVSMVWEVEASHLDSSTARHVNHGAPFYISNPGAWYMTVAEVTMTRTSITFVNAKNIRIDGTNHIVTQNNSSNYQIYRIDGIL